MSYALYVGALSYALYERIMNAGKLKTLLKEWVAALTCILLDIKVRVRFHPS